MATIKNKNGDSYSIKKKYVKICDLNFIITKKTPTGEQTYFMNGYEATTGHWVANGKKEADVIKRIEDKMPNIKRLLDKLDDNVGGLFG